jgi:outer membrane receptor protein involved in Fe transport
MITPNDRLRFWLTALAAGGSLLSATIALAQSVPERNRNPAAAAVTPEEENIIVLSPFEVTDTKREGYMATSSLAGSRLNTALRDIAAPISVITEQFLRDTGATSVSDILIYTTSTEVAGPYGNYLGTSSGDVGGLNDILRTPHRGTRVRGLNSADLTRDFSVTDIPLDSYNVSAVDVSRGPNSILYGLGSPAGIINYALKTPIMSENRYIAEFRVGSFGSHRESLDVNQALIPGILGVRVTGVNDEAQFEQEHKFDHGKRAYGVMRWTPRLADRLYTEFTVNFETGQSRARRPALTPPEDFMTNWFTNMNKWTKTTVHDNTGFGPFTVGSPNNNWWDSLAVVYGDPSTNTVGVAGGADAIRNRGGNPWGGWVGVAPVTWNIWGDNPLSKKQTFAGNPDLTAIINDYESKSGRAFTGFGGWRDPLILDRSVFDYRKRSLAGPNSSQLSDYDATALTFRQTYLDGIAGFEVAYDRQNYSDGYNNLIGGSNRITIDINRFLRNGAPNPNLGRPLVVDATDGNIRETVRENLRATAFYKTDFETILRRQNRLTDILGSHVFTAVAAEQKYSLFSRGYNLYGFDESYTRLDSDDRVFGLHYLGGSLLNASNLTGANIQGIDVLRTPPAKLSAMVQGSTRVNPPINHWDVVQVGTFLDPEQMYNSAGANKSTATNKSFIWQSRFFKDTVIGLLGYRQDSYEKWTKGAALRDARGKTMPFDPKWSYDGTIPIRADANTRSYGVMVHSPEFIKRHLPWGSSISLGYNKSSNFDPGSVSVDIYGKQNPYGAGESEDYTLLVTALEDRFSLRVTHYETVQKNTRWRGTAPGIWDIKGRMARAMNGLMTETWKDGRIAMDAQGNITGRQNTTPEAIVNRWMFGDSYDKTLAAQPLPTGWTAASHPQLLTQPLRIRASALTTPEGSLDASGALLNQPPISVEEANYRAAWFAARTDAEWYRPFGPELFAGLDFRRDPNRNWGFWDENTPPNYANMSDITSKGWEYELNMNPTKNWRLTMNASEQEAVAANIMTTLGRFFEENRTFFRDGYNSDDNGRVVNYWKRNGFADIDFWGNANTQNMGEITSNAERNYLIGAASEGRPINELRRWSYRLVSSYDFTDGALKGWGVGGSVRWEDKAKIGYLPKYLASLNQWIDDLDRPYYAPAETQADLWVNYRRKIMRDIEWSVQLNVRNLLADDDYIATGAQPDGTIAQARIASPTTWTLSTRFEF